MKVLTLLYHDSYENHDPDSSGFAGGGPGRYKMDITEMRKHFEAVEAVRHSKPATAPELLRGASNATEPFLITFDDGGVSAITQIAPLLEEFGWRGHFFVTAGRVGEATFLDRDQISLLARRGHVIGSHSWSHPARMSKCTSEELDFEWRNSIEFLSDIIGQRVEAASVPGGYFSSDVAKAAARAGIKVLFTSEPSKRAYVVDGCLVMGRFTLLDSMPPTVSGSLASDGLSRQQFKQYALWNVKKAAKNIAGEKYLAIRRAILNKGPNRE